MSSTSLSKNSMAKRTRRHLNKTRRLRKKSGKMNLRVIQGQKVDQALIARDRFPIKKVLVMKNRVMILTRKKIWFSPVEMKRIRMSTNLKFNRISHVQSSLINRLFTIEFSHTSALTSKSKSACLFQSKLASIFLKTPESKRANGIKGRKN